MRAPVLCLLTIVAVALSGCTSTDDVAPAAAPAAGGAWASGSITSAPASMPCGAAPCAPLPQAQAPAAGPAGAPVASMRPGEVWCSYYQPPVYETNTEVIEKCGARWEWRRTSECEVPGANGVVQGGAPAPGQVWCYVKVPPQTETRTQRVLKSPGGWTWRRTSECEVPVATPAPVLAPLPPSEAETRAVAPAAPAPAEGALPPPAVR